MSSCLNANLLTVFPLVHYGYFVCITLWVVFSRRRKKNEIIIASYMCLWFFIFISTLIFYSSKNFFFKIYIWIGPHTKKYVGHNHRCVSICAIWVGFLVFREFYFSFFSLHYYKYKLTRFHLRELVSKPTCTFPNGWGVLAHCTSEIYRAEQRVEVVVPLPRS